MNLGERLKAERERLGLNQTDFAALAGASKHAQINWEKGVASPNAAALAAWADAGIDVLYVVAGQSSKPVVDPNAALTTHLIDAERLGRIVDLLESFASTAGKRWPAKRLAVVAAEVYNVLADEPALDEPKVERILKLVVNR